MIIIADGSHWVTFNVAGLQAANVSGLMWKATEGGTFQDASYAMAYADCHRTSFPFVAMHYVNAGATVDAELANILSVVDKATPLVLDIEAGSGSIDHVKALYQKLIAAGYHIPFVYLPEWYWASAMGSPDLSSLPPLWASRYVSNTGAPQSLSGQVPISWWAGYGNNVPALLQYTDKATITGQTIGDMSLFTGDLAQFLRYLDPANFTYPADEDNMITGSLPAGQNTRKDIVIPVGRQVEVTLACDGSLSISNIYGWIAPEGGNGFSTGAVNVPDKGAYSFRPTKGTAKLDVQYTASAPVDYVVDIVG
jgi:hypothetical protein